MRITESKLRDIIRQIIKEGESRPEKISLSGVTINNFVISGDTSTGELYIEGELDSGKSLYYESESLNIDGGAESIVNQIRSEGYFGDLSDEDIENIENDFSMMMSKKVYSF